MADACLWSLAADNRDTELVGVHDHRVAYACERNYRPTGAAAPVIAGERVACRVEVDPRNIEITLGMERPRCMI